MNPAVLFTALRAAVSALAASWRTEVVGREHVDRLRAQGRPIVLAVWHGRLLPALLHHRGDRTTLLISAHRDGGYLEGVASGWGFSSIRGSTRRAGSRALREMIAVLRGGGTLGITPDGPRGPARVVKPGVVVAAGHAGAAIVPVGTAASHAWRARSWDSFVLPRAGARVRLVYGPPVIPPRRSPDRSGVCHELTEALNDATRRAEWRL